MNGRDSRASIRLAVVTHGAGEIIAGREARLIAGAWQGGPSSGLYALANTGAICSVDVLERELNRSALYAANTGQHEEMEALRAYVQHHGARGPIDDWTDMG